MPEIRFLTPEQEAKTPEYQEKWKRISVITQPIEKVRAAAAIKGVYAVMGKPEPDFVFCSSPRAALDHLQAQVSQVDIPQNPRSRTKEDIQNNFIQFFAEAAWGTIKQSNKQQNSGTKPIYDLLMEVSNKPTQAVEKHIERCLPKDLSTQDMVEQVFLSATPMIDLLGKHQARRGDPEFSKRIQDKSQEDWQRSFSDTAFALDMQLGWLPGKEYFFQGWMKKYLQGTLIAKINGMESPRFRETLAMPLSFSEQKYLVENAVVVISEFAYQCSWLDFAISELNYPYDAKKWAALQGLAKYCGWVFAVDNLCIICDRPTHILIDDDYQLHGEGEPAVQFADGFAAYAYHGTPIPEKYGTVHPQEWQAQWVFEERNRALQEMLVQSLGAIRVCQELPLIEVDTLQEYALLKLKGVGVSDTHVLKRVKAETGDILAVFVPWHQDTVRSAINYANENYFAEDFPIPDNEN